jgi:hypothetical protein
MTQRNYWTILWAVLCLVALNQQPLTAQIATHRLGNPISFYVSGQNVAAGFVQRFVLTDSMGIIRYTTPNLPFMGVAAGTYKAYALTYDASQAAPTLTHGTAITAIGGSCVDTSNALRIGVLGCSNATGNITATITGQNLGAGFTQKYALTDSVGRILQVLNTPSVSGLSNGIYNLYGVNYETASGVTGLTVGQYIVHITGANVAISQPLGYVVCLPTSEIADNGVDDDNDGLIDCHDPDLPACPCTTTSSIAFNLTSPNPIAGMTTQFILTDSLGFIRQILNTPSVSGLINNKKYRIYALNYETASGVTGLTIGQTISNISGTCVALSTPLLYKTCIITDDNCNDGIDNDQDGLTDCADSDCASTLANSNINLKILLEGPYSTATGKMTTILNQRGLLPGQTPIGIFGTPTPIGQPFNIAPWYYNGTEGDGFTNYPATVVDWVLVSLRSTTAATSTVFRCAALLHEDGIISFTKSCIQLPHGDYYLVIEHRNHLGVMSPSLITVTNNILNFDFTAGESYQTNNPPTWGQKLLSNGKWVLFTGDCKKDTPVSNYDINFSDSQLWKAQTGIFDKYRFGDFNLDADVNFGDSQLWKRNNGRYSAVPH